MRRLNFSTRGKFISGKKPKRQEDDDKPEKDKQEKRRQELVDRLTFKKQGPAKSASGKYGNIDRRWTDIYCYPNWTCGINRN
jgi:hypothetical protein